MMKTQVEKNMEHEGICARLSAGCNVDAERVRRFPHNCGPVDLKYKCICALLPQGILQYNMKNTFKGDYGF